MSRSMSALQDSYWQDSYWQEVGRKYGLARGQKGSKRRHHRPVHDAPMPGHEQARPVARGRGGGVER